MATPKVSINRVNLFIEDGLYLNAIQTSNLLVSMYGDAMAYFLRAKTKIATGQLDQSVFNDFEYSCKLSKWGNKQILKTYAKSLWEFVGYDKKLHKVLSYLEKMENLTEEDKLFLSAAYADGGYSLKIKNLLNTEFNEILSKKNHYFYLWVFLLESQLFEEKDKSIQKLPQTYNKILNTTKLFEERIINNPKDFCLVGNSPIEIGKNNGKKIDSYECVIRFNTYSTRYQYVKDYGTKTDVWVRMVKNMGISEKNADVDLVILTGSNILNRQEDGAETFSLFLKQYAQVGIIPFDIYKNLVLELNSVPSSGLQIMYWIYSLIGKIDKSQVFGFSLTDQKPGKDAQYNSSITRNVRHNWENEKKLLNKIVH
jgi:hypothetical protein